MLPFEISHFPAEFLKPLTTERAKRRQKSADAAATAEARERVLTVVLLLCVLAAGIYGEILRYDF